MQETNLLAAGVPSRTVLGELTAHPDLLAGGEGGWLPLPQEPSLPGPDLRGGANWAVVHGFHKTVKNYYLRKHKNTF